MAPNAHLEHLKGPVAQVFIEGKGLLAQGPAVIHDLESHFPDLRARGIERQTSPRR